jgi:hypothetical protein
VQFINRLADSVARKYPDVLLDTLAYDYTLPPPRRLRLRNNVVVRLADLQSREFLRPVTHRSNRKLRRTIERWAKHTSHLRIWGYTVTFGHTPNNLPLPNLRVIAEDFRYYREQKIEGLFIQHDHPVHADMRDLKLWIVFKLAEDPTRDLDALIRDFTDGFYGPAGGTVREYLAALERAARRTPSSIRHPTEASQYRYLTPEFLRRAHALFDRAEDEVRGNRTLTRRVRHARLTLDRATLLLWDASLTAPPGSAEDGAPLDPDRVARRYRKTAIEQAKRRLPPYREDEVRKQVVREVAKGLRRIRGKP